MVPPDSLRAASALRYRPGYSRSPGPGVESWLEELTGGTLHDSSRGLHLSLLVCDSARDESRATRNLDKTLSVKFSVGWNA